MVDEKAKESAGQQRRRLGGIQVLQEPQLRFLVNRFQQHDLSTYIHRQAMQTYAEQYVVTPPKDQDQLQLYTDLVMTGMVSWRMHLRTVARPLWQPAIGVCLPCTSAGTGCHKLQQCPLGDLTHWYLHIKLL